MLSEWALCKRRNAQQSRYNGYRCSRRCRSCEDCAFNEKCVCDDECGKSCVDKSIKCTNPPDVKGAESYVVYRFTGNRKLTVENTADYRIGDMVRYECMKGLNLTGPLPRCSKNGRWTNGKPQCIDFEKCGQAGEVRLLRQVNEFALVKGEESTETAWPWQALISERKKTAYLTFSRCSTLGGGSLINKRWILTAAHLFTKYALSSTDPENWSKQIAISLGVIQRPTRSNFVRSIRMFVADDVVMHEGFNALTFESDIALVKLGNRLEPKTMEEIPNTDNGVTYGYYIRPVCLPCTGSCFKRNGKGKKPGRVIFRPNMSEKRMCKLEGKLLLRGRSNVVVTGFGHTEVVHSPIRGCISASSYLQQGQLRVLKNAKCREFVSHVNANETLGVKMVFNDNFLCCSGKNAEKRTDACQGDSGGPVVRKVTDKTSGTSCWIQIGIVSWGIGCGLGHPSFYTNVATFAQWIKDTLNGYEFCQSPTESRTGFPSSAAKVLSAFGYGTTVTVPRLKLKPKCARLREGLPPTGPPGFVDRRRFRNAPSTDVKRPGQRTRKKHA